ncbi:MAG: protease pro-enzyme activation domain-containing protein [Terracidiphilus sp.]
MRADEEQSTILPDRSHRLAGSERLRPASHKHLGQLDQAEAVAISLVVRRKPDSAALPDLRRWQDTPPGKRKHISPDEYARTYGADPAELDAAAAFIRAQGMTVLEAHAGRRTVAILGTAAQMKAVFGVELHRYEDPRAAQTSRSAQMDGEGAGAEPARWHRGFDGAVSLPTELAGIVVAAVGLDNRFLGTPREGTVGDQSGASYPPVSTVAEQYNFPNTDASGETIGIFAPQACGSPGTPPCYLPSDINNLYFPNLPSGYRTGPASIVDVNLTVGATTYKNDPSQVTGITNLASANRAILELTQDISTSATLAQGATVNVYFTEASEQGYLAFMNRVLLPENEKQPTVLSLSFGAYLGDAAKGGSEMSRIGPHCEPGSLSYLIDELFRQVALLGISVFIAVGDWGAETWHLLAAPNLVPPAAAPQFDGGFHAGAASSSLAKTHLGNYAGFLALQNPFAPGVGGALDPAAGTRGAHGIPDISGQLAYSGFFVNGISYSYEGASCVAPFYAGMTATLRSAFGVGLGFLNTILLELKKTAFHDGSDGDNASHGTSGTAAGRSSGRKSAAPEANLFAAGIGHENCAGPGYIEGARLLSGVGRLGYIPSC